MLVGRWSWGLIKTSGGILLDRQAPESTRQAISESIEAVDDNRITDLHVWSIGPGIYAAEVALLTRAPQSPGHYKALVPGELGVVHLSVEVHCDADQGNESDG